MKGWKSHRQVSGSVAAGKILSLEKTVFGLTSLLTTNPHNTGELQAISASLQ